MGSCNSPSVCVPALPAVRIAMTAPCGILQVPIYVYLSNAEMGKGRGFSPISKYGEKFAKAAKDRPRRRPVRLLYTGGNHYDLLVK